MKAKAIIRIKFSSKKRLDTVLTALYPEIGDSITSRSKVILKKEDDFLELDFKAKDTIALRAVLNAYLRWVNSLVGVLDVLEAR